MRDTTGKRGPKGPGRNAGFTMLEIIVAISVLLVATMAAFGSQVASFGVIDSSRDSTIAMTDLEVCMEELLTQSTDVLPTSYPAGTPVAGFEGLHLPSESIAPSYPGYAGGDVPDPLQIVLTATWSDSRGRPQTLTLGTSKTR